MLNKITSMKNYYLFLKKLILEIDSKIKRVSLEMT